MTKINAEQQRELSFFAAISLIFIYPIIHANVFFRDDLLRSLKGYGSWDFQGRPLADLVQSIAASAFSWHLPDVAPLTQILTVFCLAAAGYSFNQYLKSRQGRGSLIASSLLMLNPFFLANASYRFDAFGMALAFLLSVMAFTQCVKKQNNGGRLSLSSVFLLFCTLCLYQPMINVTLGLLSVEWLIRARDGRFKDALYTLCLVTLHAACALIIYYLTIPALYMAENSRSSTIPLSGEGLQMLINNMTVYSNILASYLVGPTFVYLSASVVLTLALIPNIIRHSSTTWQVIPGLILGGFIWWLSLFGPFVLLSEPTPTYRTMPTFFFIFVLLALLASWSRFKLRYIAILPIVVAIATSYKLGVALKNQQDFNESVMNMVTYDLVSRSLDQEKIYVIGVPAEAPRNSTVYEANLLIRSLSYPASAWISAGDLLMRGLKNTQFLWSGSHQQHEPQFKNDLCHSQREPLVVNSFYTLLNADEHVYVMLGTNIPAFCESDLSDSASSYTPTTTSDVKIPK
ncbi:Uncharacterised protein [BD1-7 clade bacterium]|nr:Uncharacterised protein [BD1-7 clade bacterium]